MRRLLIANRGDVARRVARTAHRLGVDTVAVVAPDDETSPHALEAGTVVRVPSYLDAGALVEAARRTGCDAVHPGWGFLAESPAFASACGDAGLVFVGPRPETVALLGDKVRAKRAMADAGVPILPADGFPLLVKAAAGGGGRGMRLVERAEDLDDARAAASREALAAFGDGTVFTERYLPRARHVEVQVVADEHGHVLHLFERECSIQRRHQKVVEESPSPGVDEAVRARLLDAAVAGARAVGYVGAGTFELLLGEDGTLAFLEVNTRLQVEHPVTEAVTGLDLVELQLLVADGQPLPVAQGDVATTGHAIEVRVVAEDPAQGWLPSAGRIELWQPPDDDVVRWDAQVATGTVVGGGYDSLLAKAIAWGRTRDEAARRLARAVAGLRCHGVATNAAMLVATLRSEAFLAGDTTTAFLDEHAEVLDPAVDAALRQRRLVAATAAAASARRAAAPVLAFAPAGWRNVPGLRQEAAWDHGTVRYGADGVDVDGVELAARWAVEGSVVAVDVGGVVTRHAVHLVGERAYVDDDEGSVALEEAPRFPDPGVAAVGGGPLAPVPGTVLQVLVAEGDVVEEGQVLVVLEAMKVEHRITAPAASRVVGVPVQAGQAVEAKAQLVALEPL